MNAYWSPSPYRFADLIGLTVRVNYDLVFRFLIVIEDYAIGTQVTCIAPVAWPLAETFCRSGMAPGTALGFFWSLGGCSLFPLP
jgi:hypothetical protein